MTTAIRRPPGRYDEPTRLPRPVLLALAALGALALLALTYLAWDRTTGGRTHASVLGYRVVDDHAIEVRFEVAKNHAATVVCALRARDRDGVLVGSEDVTVGPGNGVVTHRLTTSSRAAVAEVTGCST
jgi:hypothetical protein